MDHRLAHVLAPASALAILVAFMPPELQAADAPQEPDAPAEESSNVQRVVNGAVTSDHPATAALMEQGLPFCTGSLIRPNVILTAAHCLEYGPPDDVYFGDQPGVGGETVPATSALMHPSYTASESGDAYYDIGLVFLGEDASPAPFPVANISGEALIGAPIVYVGYGTAQGTGGEGFKKEATATVTELEADVLVVQPDNGSACYGDSGGPVLHMNSGGAPEIVGVVSFGYTDDCMDLGGNTRTDMYFDWINENAGGEPPAGDDDDDGWSGDDDDAPGDDDDWSGEGDDDDWNGEGDDANPPGSWSDDDDAPDGSFDDCSFTDQDGRVWTAEDCADGADPDGGRACDLSDSASPASLAYLLPLGLFVRRRRTCK